MARRELSKPEAFMPGPPGKAQRNRAWERRQQGAGKAAVTFRRIPVGVREEINTIARGLYVNRDEVARALLEAGLEAYHKGLVRLEHQLINGRFYLYAENACDDEGR